MVPSVPRSTPCSPSALSMARTRPGGGSANPLPQTTAGTRWCWGAASAPPLASTALRGAACGSRGGKRELRAGLGGGTAGTQRPGAAPGRADARGSRLQAPPLPPPLPPPRRGCCGRERTGSPAERSAAPGTQRAPEVGEPRGLGRGKRGDRGGRGQLRGWPPALLRGGRGRGTERRASPGGCRAPGGGTQGAAGAGVLSTALGTSWRHRWHRSELGQPERGVLPTVWGGEDGSPPARRCPRSIPKRARPRLRGPVGSGARRGSALPLRSPPSLGNFFWRRRGNSAPSAPGLGLLLLAQSPKSPGRERKERGGFGVLLAPRLLQERGLRARVRDYPPVVPGCVGQDGQQAGGWERVVWGWGAPLGASPEGFGVLVWLCVSV